MRRYHQKVFDDFVQGTGIVYSNAECDEKLASTDFAVLVAVLSDVGGSGSLTVAQEDSPDRVRWLASSTSINAEALTAGTVAITGGYVTPASAFTRLRIQLTGASPKVRLCVYATGRDNNTNLSLGAAQVSGTVSVPNSPTEDDIALTTADWGTGAGAAPGSNGIVVTTPGIYEIVHRTQWASAHLTQRTRAWLNGSPVDALGLSVAQIEASYAQYMRIEQAAVDAGGVITLGAEQNSGAAMNLTAIMTVTRIGGL